MSKTIILNNQITLTKHYIKNKLIFSQIFANGTILETIKH